MAKNYTNEMAGEVGSKLFPVLATSGPVLGFGAFVCVVGMVAIGINGAYSAMTGSAEDLDLYMQHRSSGLMLLVLVLPSLVALPFVSWRIGDRWTPSFRKTKILGLLLAFTWLSMTAVSLVNGSQLWSQLAYHWDRANSDRSLIMAQTCPVEVAKAGYERIAHDPKSPYALIRCDKYLSPSEVVDTCWREFRAVKPIKWSICGWKRREMTGVNWPIEDPVELPGQPKDVFATEAEMRAVLAKKGLTPL